MPRIRQFHWSDYDAVVAVWANAGREVVGETADAVAVCTKPLPAAT